MVRVPILSVLGQPIYMVRARTLHGVIGTVATGPFLRRQRSNLKWRQRQISLIINA